MKRMLLALFAMITITLQAQINITVKNPSNFNQINSPVTLGVPIAKGVLFNLSNLEIQDNLNSTVPAQFSTMATWNDGSIKWVKTHFQASVNSNSNVQYSFLLNGANPVVSGITAVETVADIEINTGALKFKVNKTNYNLLDSAWIDLNNNGVYETSEQLLNSNVSTGFIAEDGQQNIFNSNNNIPDTIYIEEQGDLFTVIKIEGKHYNNAASSYFLKYETRIYAFANKSYIKIRHSYANGNSVTSLGDSGNPAFGVDVEEYSLNLNFNMTGNKAATLGGDNGAPLPFSISTGDYLSLIQQDRATTSIPFNYNVNQLNGNVSLGNKADGWMGIADQNFGVLISGKYFWEKYPKGIKADYGNHLTYQFIPDNTNEFLWAAQGSGDELLLHFYPANEYNLVAERAENLSKKPLFAYADSNAFITSKDRCMVI